MHYWDSYHVKIYMFYGKEVEIANYITRCKDKTRQEMLRQSIDNVLDILIGRSVDPELMAIVQDYLLSQEEKKFVECLWVSTSCFL